jgi:hypothetical protein
MNSKQLPLKPFIKYSELVNSPDGEELSLSPPVDILEKANSASGKLGGVAGVLHGVHT